MSSQTEQYWEHLGDAVRILPRRIIEAQEAERSRIAQEIHDDLGQSLAALKMMVQSSVTPAQLKASRRNRRAYDRVVQYIDEIIEKSRSIATSLRPKVLDTIGLTRALKKLVGDIRKSKHIRIRAHIGHLDDLSFCGEPLNLYRIVQEALANLLHHAEASDVEIIFRRAKKTLNMVLKDNGKGFLPKEIRRDAGSSRGLGLSTMQERARLLKGELTIDSAPGCGTTIRLSVPVAIDHHSKGSGNG